MVLEPEEMDCVSSDSVMVGAVRSESIAVSESSRSCEESSSGGEDGVGRSCVVRDWGFWFFAASALRA